MKIYGHRGAAALAPENTLEGIRAAAEACADGFECDVRQTADGELVLMHDDALARTTDGLGRLSECSFEALRALDAGSRFTPDGATFPFRGARVATLAEALDAARDGRLRAILEVKSNPFEPGYDPTEAVARAVGRVLRARGEDLATVSSFNPSALSAAREEHPSLDTALLVSERFSADAGIDAAATAGHGGVHLAQALVARACVERAHDAGLELVAWTVDEPGRLRAFADWGVDAVIADDPAAARAALDG